MKRANVIRFLNVAMCIVPHIYMLRIYFTLANIGDVDIANKQYINLIS